MGKRQVSFFMAFILIMTLFVPMKITALAEAQEVTGTLELSVIRICTALLAFIHQSVLTSYRT